MRSISLLALLTIVCVNATSAQVNTETDSKLPNFYEKPLHWGFLLGINQGDFTLQTDLANNDSLIGVSVAPANGFSLGIAGEWLLTKKIALRSVPQLSFTQRNLSYTVTEGSGGTRIVSKPVESTYLSFPLHMKITSGRFSNKTLYAVGGARYNNDLTSQEHVDQKYLDDIFVAIKRHSLSADIGVGMEFFTKSFRISPELSYSYGITNVVHPDGTAFSEPLTDIRAHLIQFSVLFVGE